MNNLQKMTDSTGVTVIFINLDSCLGTDWPQCRWLDLCPGNWWQCRGPWESWKKVLHLLNLSWKWAHHTLREEWNYPCMALIFCMPVDNEFSSCSCWWRRCFWDWRAAWKESDPAVMARLYCKDKTIWQQGTETLGFKYTETNKQNKHR